MSSGTSSETTYGMVRSDTPARRLVDVLVGSVGLVASAPAFILAGLAIRLSDGGPTLFRQVRVGKDGQPFLIVKFRTMTPGADFNGPAVSGSTDPRITPVGSLLRKYRLDEIPQLINLVRGDVTLFGPRPEVPRYVGYYTDEELLTLKVRPGIIGPGAIWFASHQADALDMSTEPEELYLSEQLHEKLRLDLEYLYRRSWLRDLHLLGSTVQLLLSRATGRVTSADQ